jgi:hypothetical protein
VACFLADADIKNVREAIAVYLDHCRARGEEPPKEVDTAYIDIDVQDVRP